MGKKKEKERFSVNISNQCLLSEMTCLFTATSDNELLLLPQSIESRFLILFLHKTRTESPEGDDGANVDAWTSP